MRYELYYHPTSKDAASLFGWRWKKPAQIMSMSRAAKAKPACRR